MSDLAKRLIRIDERTTQSAAPRAIFGTLADLPNSIVSAVPYRIGMWPCISETQPEVAMGIWSSLGYLLEHRRDVRVYRLFVQLEGDPDDFEWTINQSQFDIDDWELEDLDENVAVWGELVNENDEWILTSYIESDLAEEDEEDEEAITLKITATSITNLLKQLPDFARQIAETIEAERHSELLPLYDISDDIDADSLNELMDAILRWDAHLLALLWGYDWEDDDVLELFQEMVEAGQETQSDFGTWLVSNAIAQTMRPGFSLIGDLMRDEIQTIISAFPDSHYPAVLMSDGLYKLGYTQESFRYMAQETKAHPNSAEAWLKYGELLGLGGRIEEAIDKFQSAIENEATNAPLYFMYGNVLRAAEQYKQPVESFILIDIDDIEEERVRWEAVEAYEEVLKLQPDHIRAQHLQLNILAIVDDVTDRLWAGFDKLVQLDETGLLVRDVIDGLYDDIEFEAGFNTLKQAIEKEPERVDLYTNLVSLYLVANDPDSADEYLEKALGLSDSPDVLADIEQLKLIADDPEFEYRFSEITVIVSAGNSISADDVEFLEDVTEKAPHLMSGFLTLARAYAAWGDSDAAIEVLLDVQEKTPDNPSVLELLGELFWEAGEQELAFQYLNRGVATSPLYVPILTRIGRYLFDNDQLAESKQFLAYAEDIAPNDPTLNTVRSYIAQRIEANPDKYEGFISDQ